MIKTLSLALTMLLVLCTGCAGLPAPKNANGTVSPTVTVGDADLTYQNLSNYATTYIASCHAAPTTPGCNDTLVMNLKSASTRVKNALHAAHNAVNTLQPGATGIDSAISDLQAALVFLESFTNTIPASFKKGAQSWTGPLLQTISEAA